MAIDNLLEMIVNEFCLPLPYIVRPGPIIHKPLFIGSFFIGLFLGILIACPLVYFYSKHWAVKRKFRRKRFDIESIFLRFRPAITKKWSFFFPTKTVTSQSLQQTNIVRTEINEINITEKTDIENTIGSKRGMVDVLMQKNSDAVLEEVTKQDIEVLEKIETDQDADKDKMMMKILENSLIKESENGNLPNDVSIGDFMKNMEKDLQEIYQTTKKEKADKKATLKRENLFNKNSSDIDDLGFDKDRSLNNRLKREMKKEKIKKLRNNFRQSDIDLPVAERIQTKLEQFNAMWDRVCSLEQKRMCESLEKRQKKRRIVAENKILTQKKKDQSLNESASLLAKVLSPSVNNGQLTDKQCQDLIGEFKTDMMRRRKHLDEETSQQLEVLAKKLRERRVKELNKLEDKHLEDKRKLMEIYKTNENPDMESSVQDYLSKMTQMNAELENKRNELDQHEDEEVGTFLKQMNEGRSAEIAEVEQELFNELKTKTNFTQNEAQNMIHQYQALQKKHSESCEKTHREQESLFKEQLEKQIEGKKERKKMAEAEQAAILNEQQTILTKMLEDNMDEEKKEEIFQNHKEKMQELCNHMETTRIKQEQNLQVLLAQRRAKVQELREKKENATKEKQNRKLQEKLTAEIEAAELKLAEEKAAAEETLRQHLIEETKLLLDQQQNELAADIGKLEVEKARRKALLNRRDNTLQCLHKKLEVLVDSERTPQGLSNEIVEHHTNIMHRLEYQQREERERQQGILQAKMDEKHKKKQRELSREFDENKLKETQNQKQRGVSIAGSILSNALAEKQHENSMANLKKEMQAELERKRRDLNAAQERNLDEELKLQEQKFFNELAALSDLDTDEIKDVINHVVEETGANNKTKKKLTQNFTEELEKAETEFDVTDDEGQ